MNHFTPPPLFRHTVLIGLLIVLAGCAPAAAPPVTPIAALPRQIVTVDVRLATPPPAALIPTYTPVPLPTVAVIPTATPYIGIFLGDAGAGEGGLVDLDPARYAGTRVVIVPTADSGLACTVPPDPVYGTAWQGDPNRVRRLGCAGEPATNYPSGAVQIFERGVMYWLPTGEYFAIAPGSAGGLFWYYPAQPPSAPLPADANPPDGLRLPEDGFGVIWRAFEEARRGVGYAQIEEQPAQLLLQRFENGSLLRDAASAQTFVLLRDGTAYGPY